MMTSIAQLNRKDVAQYLKATGQSLLRDADFSGADLREADLSGISLSFVSLAGAQLDGADLTRAQVRQVDLTNASLKNARLDGARLELVHAGSASFAGARASGTRWETVDLTGADFADANLSRSVIRGCALESARFDGADLSDGMLVYSNAGRASFRKACLMWTNTVGTSFVKADFTEARAFFLCREIVAEIIKREATADPELVNIVGAIIMNRKWCYPEWKRYLEVQPKYRELAFAIFGRYPDSGCAKALQDGWRPPAPAKHAAGGDGAFEPDGETAGRIDASGAAGTRDWLQKIGCMVDAAELAVE